MFSFHLFNYATIIARIPIYKYRSETKKKSNEYPKLYKMEFRTMEKK